MAPKLTTEQVAAKLAKAMGQPVRVYSGQGGRLLGEFPDDLGNSRSRARIYFLEIIARRNPDFVPSLMALYHTEHLRMPPEAEMRRPLVQGRMPTEPELEAWAEEWGLGGAKWVISWARLAVSQHEGRWVPKGLLPPVVTVVPFNPPPPDAWQPHQTTPQVYLAYIKDQYMPAIEKLAAEAGMTKKPKPLQKRERLHFEWLVRFQVEDETQSSIVKSLGADYEHSGERSAINNAIHSLAKDIGLTLRKQR